MNPYNVQYSCSTKDAESTTTPCVDNDIIIRELQAIKTLLIDLSTKLNVIDTTHNKKDEDDEDDEDDEEHEEDNNEDDEEHEANYNNDCLKCKECNERDPDNFKSGSRICRSCFNKKQRTKVSCKYCLKLVSKSYMRRHIKKIHGK